MAVQIDVLRAIGSEFISRKLKPVLLVADIFALIIMIAAVWLTTLSVWWWLLAGPVLILTMIGLFAFLAVRKILTKLSPKLDKSQKTSVKRFVDKVERVAENLQTPIFVIVFRVIYDILRPSRKYVYIKTLIVDSSTLREDFLGLQRKFK